MKKKVMIYSYTVAAILIVIFFIIVTSTSGSLPITAQGIEVKKYIGLNNSNYSELSGSNVTVAIIDSGLEVNGHFQKKRLLAFKDFVNGNKEYYDDNGHGTFIAGIIGADSGIIGIAPKSNFVILKVLDKDGKTDEERLLSAFKWISVNKQKYNIKLVNVSIGVENKLDLVPSHDPVLTMLSTLKRQGILVICSAGNNGPGENTILYPGMSNDILTIGSVNNNKTLTLSDDKVSISSSRGNSLSNLKPDLVTLGVNVSSIDYQDSKKNRIASGSSYSTAIVTGAAALLFEEYKEADIVLKVLKKNVVKLKEERLIDQGNGQLYFK